MSKCESKRVVLLLGGNIGEVLTNFRKVKNELLKLGDLALLSRVYESEAWGMENAPPFLNQVLVLETKLEALELLRQILKIEEDLGRIRPSNADGYSSRSIDIDMLFYGGEIINEPDLIVPHPRLHQRKFVLEPLCEIMKDFVHPVLKRTMHELRQNLSDNLKVEVKDD